MVIEAFFASVGGEVVAYSADMIKTKSNQFHDIFSGKARLFSRRHCKRTYQTFVDPVDLIFHL